MAATTTTPNESTQPRFSNKSTRYLRFLDFGFIRTKYKAAQGNAVLRKRANILLFLLPITVSIGVGGMHLLSQSFLIYLKYQAMVDSYYYNVVMK